MGNVGGIGHRGGLGPIDEGRPEEVAPASDTGQTVPVLPRGGISAAAAVRAKLALDQVEGKVANWRTGRTPHHPVHHPVDPGHGPIRPMYGVIAPIHPPVDPVIRPMYGVVAPIGGHPVSPGPIRPMYGVVAPIGHPPTHPPIRPMYGVIAPAPRHPGIP